ncbi:hypothetical protein DC498_08490 [Terrimonas sp.]|uniref:hypothetical protein n=1 Tax=Terrimonas sp. TaxID=1914338 RepID=UPI000D511841|nr:hypothetical protein [Terrimonas sp.]PVD52551.1 hypothetical protein DC498_08490 [Terrimonas sp.]
MTVYQEPFLKKRMSAWKIVSNLEPTVPADAPRSTIDYIFCYPQNKWRSIESSTYKVNLSDHLPVSAVVEMK